MYVSIGDYRFNEPFPDSRCGSCYHLKKTKGDSKYQYQCSASTGCKAAQLAQGKSYEGNCAEYEKPEQAILDNKPKPKFIKLLITGLILSIVYAIAIIIYSKIKNGVDINAPFILTFVTGIPIGTITFTLLRLIKNVVNKIATKMGQSFKAGGNLLGWIIATFLPYVSPIIVYFIMAGVFGVKLF